jgi:hypothetical protein
VRVADLATRAAVSASTEGRALYGLRALDVPEEPVATLWHAATPLREHRGDGHNAALVAHIIGDTEAHVLLALSLGMRQNSTADFASHRTKGERRTSSYHPERQPESAAPRHADLRTSAACR